MTVCTDMKNPQRINPTNSGDFEVEISSALDAINTTNNEAVVVNEALGSQAPSSCPNI